MPTFKIVLAYDGTDFVGWQRQAAGTSIQGLIEDALRDIAGHEVTVAGAGRTDAGVHALGQVASFTFEHALPPDVLVRAINAKVPDAVRVLSAEPVEASFHARFGARSKTYRYRIWNGAVVSPFERRYVWHVIDPLDVPTMAAGARLLEGRHDFAAFRGSGSSTHTTVREVYRSEVRAAGGELVTYEICGGGFLRHMVRTIVGSLVEVGRGRRAPEWLGEVLASRDRAHAGRTAPAAGLFLVGADYAGSLAVEC